MLYLFPGLHQIPVFQFTLCLNCIVCIVYQLKCLYIVMYWLSCTGCHATPKYQTPSPTGGLLNTTSGAHGGGGSVESRDGGEELSTPAVKRKCVHKEDNVSLQHIHLPSNETRYQMPFQPSLQSIHEPHFYAHPFIHHPSLPLPDTPLDKYANFLQSCYTKSLLLSSGHI